MEKVSKNYYFIKCEDVNGKIKGCFISKKSGKILKYKEKIYFVTTIEKIKGLKVRFLLGSKRKEFLDKFSLVLDSKTKTIKKKEHIELEDKVIASEVVKKVSSIYYGRKIELIKVGGERKIYPYAIKIGKGEHRMTTEKVKHYKTKEHAYKQFYYITGKEVKVGGK